MVIDPIFRETQYPWRTILDLLSGGQPTRKLETGVYSCGHWSFHQYLAQKYNDLPDLPGDLECVGVADDLANIKQVYRELWELPNRNFVLSIVHVPKEEQPDSGGWRWQKWGPYIGKKEPKNEYLHDEGEDIQDVYTFHFYELLDNALIV